MYELIRGNGNLLQQNLWEFPYKGEPLTPEFLNHVEKESENAVLNGFTLVIRSSMPKSICERSGVVPLRWGAPRILVAEGNWQGYHWRQAVMAGQEPCRVFRLWRYRWDDQTDALVRRAA